MNDDLTDRAPGGVISMTDGGTIVYANATLHHWLAYEPGALISQSVNVLLSVASRVFFQTHVYPLLRMEGRADEIFLSLRTSKQDSLPTIVNFVRHEVEGETCIDAVLLPMRQRERYESALLAATRAEAEARARLERAQAELQVVNEHLKMLSTIDPLTGLQNRRAFYDHLAIEMTLRLRTGSPIAVMLLDIDHFKRVNDVSGHAAGDQVLQHVANTLSANIRRNDILARYGGEEFVLLLPHTSLDEACALGERLRLCIEDETTVTISVGVAGMDDSSLSDMDLLACADEALYASKRNGRNLVTCCVAKTLVESR